MGEMVMDATNYDGTINYTTNWTLAGGSLTDSVSFESSFSTTTANHESDDGINPAAVDHTANLPLLLLPPVPNGDPCEITSTVLDPPFTFTSDITFAQEHELRQVYIRSTARVYEVYYTKKKRDDREYLCTVRCGVAMTEDEEVLKITPLIESPASENGLEPVKDDLVEVKSGENDLLSVPQLGQQDLFEATAEIDDAEPCVSVTLRLLSLQDKRCALVDEVYVFADPDLFEATAEIDDAEPCVSVTLRLLSLQDKRCALVDEVYVFADPVDPSEADKEEASGMGNSSSSALMAMFMPTLLQMSRGKDVRKEHDRQVSGKFNNPASLGDSNESDRIVNEIQQETDVISAYQKRASLPVVANTLAEHADATRVPEAEIKRDVPCSNVETILHQLVNKVSRLETILTSFEDRMLKPVISIDARLQLVEEKLEELGKKSFESELFVETKVPNPGPQSSDTDKTHETDQLDGLNKNTDDPQLASCAETVVPDSASTDKEEDYAVVQPKNSNEEVGHSAESEVSNEEVGHSLGNGSFEENPKRSVSINDALASALAGLLSSTSITDRKYSQALVVRAPEFSDEDDMETEEKSLAGSLPDKSQVAAEVLGNTSSASESPTSPRKEPGITLCIEDGTQEMINGVPETLGDNMGGYADAETVVSVSNHGLEGDTVTSSTKNDHYPERENNSYELRNPDALDHELKNSNVTAEESEEEPEMDDILKSVLGFQPNTSSVDFLAPVLDVKFNSERKVSDSKRLFEALFTEECKTVVVDCNKEGFGDDNLVSVEDEEELKGPPTDTLSSLEFDCYETNEMHLQLNDCNNGGYGGDNLVSVEDEELKGPPTDTLSSLEMDHYARNEVLLQLNAEISTASLI
ncbi:hypothetical protein F2Q69_00055976 [Brassica cretica]|uniref:Uncharacterized protein n=1 Tax=Brassica cretica TaxID=69181 RepID=A0A8S9N9H6_BRACR|nr:hypothetical protein F2Q69_00055976 [Brassica cretica]